MPVGSFKTLIEQKLGKFPNFLIYAILEWMMIILLFIDGLLAFVSNEFAKFFGLRIPCLLCTRIDHVLVQRNSSFYYNDSICEVHKKDISSLAYCHMHKKLSDIRSMCQKCLLSFATEKDSDCDKYKSLVGMLHKDIDCFVENDQKLLMKPLKKDDKAIFDEKSDIPLCSCCGEPLKLKSSSNYVRNLSMNSPAPSPSPRASFLASRNEEGRSIESPRFRYSETKLISDNKSEVLEDDASNFMYPISGKQDVKATTAPLQPNSKDTNEETNIRTPTFTRANKFFGIPLNSAPVSPRWVNRGTIRKYSVDKGEFVVEPSDANEVDGEILNLLKKQVRLDHKSLMELYMELDEERNASNVAANNAMAMITRLQAEKAAVQMEALQYQRMMEEQAEYDEEALQVMKDLLEKRDEDIKALESELEMYREKYGIIKKVGSEICEVDDEDYQDRKSQSLYSFSDDKSDSGSLNGGDQNGSERTYERSMENGRGNQEDLSLDLEGERYYLFGLLNDLEKNINANEGSNSSELGTIKHEDEDRGNKNKVTLTREVSLIKERLRAIEADSGFLKHAAMTLQRGEEGTKLLTEIAHHLRKIRHSIKSSPDNIEA
ncbi:hypothetical protein DH2020_012994 [Rehmannia glutinosa]|uniref:GTD-binding domain-containing protein n=1 Tax=Rehmannia glutinosa TaxID=99300 RepID=A0ABR0X4I9_REHGL